jgi:hypothetical protein
MLPKPAEKLEIPVVRLEHNKSNILSESVKFGVKDEPILANTPVAVLASLDPTKLFRPGEYKGKLIFEGKTNNKVVYRSQSIEFTITRPEAQVESNPLELYWSYIDGAPCAGGQAGVKRRARQSSQR